MTKLITPSKPDLWTGRPSADSVFTHEQLAAAIKLRDRIQRSMDRGNPRDIGISQTYFTRETGEIPQTRTQPCILLAYTRDRKRAHVITPSGLDAWVDVRGEQ